MWVSGVQRPWSIPSVVAAPLPWWRTGTRNGWKSEATSFGGGPTRSTSDKGRRSRGHRGGPQGWILGRTPGTQQPTPRGDPSAPTRDACGKRKWVESPFSSTVRENLAGRPREDGDPDSPIHFDALGRPVIHDRVVVMYTPLRLPRSRPAGWDGAQKEPGLDGMNKVTQLAADRLPGRAEAPGEACVQIVDPLIWPSKEPGMDGGRGNFCFSTPHGFNENHWIISSHWWDGLDSKVELVAANIVCSTFQIIGLTVCENHGCLMNNGLGVEGCETAESVLMLCPTCFRALQLIGGFDDGKAVLAGLREFLQGDSATVRSKRELDRLNKWLPDGN